MHSHMQSTKDMYIDYANKNDCCIDDGGKLFANHKSIDQNKRQINANIYNNVMDYLKNIYHVVNQQH